MSRHLLFVLKWAGGKLACKKLVRSREHNRDCCQSVIYRALAARGDKLTKDQQFDYVNAQSSRNLERIFQKSEIGADPYRAANDFGTPDHNRRRNIGESGHSAIAERVLRHIGQASTQAGTIGHRCKGFFVAADPPRSLGEEQNSAKSRFRFIRGGAASTSSQWLKRARKGF